MFRRFVASGTLVTHICHPQQPSVARSQEMACIFVLHRALSFGFTKLEANEPGRRFVGFWATAFASWWFAPTDERTCSDRAWASKNNVDASTGNCDRGGRTFSTLVDSCACFRESCDTSHDNHSLPQSEVLARDSVPGRCGASDFCPRQQMVPRTARPRDRS